MASKPRPSTRSSNPKTTKKRTSGRTGASPRPQRGNTPEAREQDRRAAKTHPTRHVGARRKDKPTGRAAPSAAAQPPKPREPAMKRREKRGQKRLHSPTR